MKKVAIVATATATLALCAVLLVSLSTRETLPEAFARRYLQSCVHGKDGRGWSWMRCKQAESSSNGIGPTAKGSEWKNGGIVPQVIPGVGVTATQNQKNMDAQLQWIGAIIRTAKQGGPVATRVLAMNSELEKKWSWSGAGKGAVGGAVQGAFTGAVGGPKGAAVGAALGGIGGAVVGGTGGWGRRNLKSGSFGVNGGWSQGQGANVNAELKFNWKQEATLEKRLIDEIVEYAGNALRVGIQKGAATLGEKGAHFLDVFADDLRAASAALRSLSERDSHPDREKLSIALLKGGIPELSWNNLIRKASPEWVGMTEETEEFAAKRISLGDRVRGAAAGGAMGFYDFGMQGAVGGAIGGWFGRRKLSGSFGVNGGWSQGQGANVNAELKFNWKKGAVAEDRKWTSPKASVAILQVIPGAEVTHQPNLDEIHAQVQWIGAVERAAQAGSAIAAQALATDKQVGEQPREKSLVGAAAGAVGGFLTGGWGGAVVGALRGFGRKLSEQTAPSQERRNLRLSVGKMVGIETQLVKDVFRCIYPRISKEEAEFAAKRISMRDRVRGAAVGGAMGFYDFGMQGAVGGAIGGFFGRRKLGGSAGVSAGWSQNQGANVQANVQINWKLLESVADDVSAVSAAVRSIGKHAQETADRSVSATGPSWSWSKLLQAYNPSHSQDLAEIEEFAAKRISLGDRVRGAAAGGAMGFYDFGMQGAVGGAIGGWFGRQ